MSLALRINNYLEEVSNLATELVAHFSDIESIKTGTVAARISVYQEMAETLLGRCDVNDPTNDAAQNQDAYDALRAEWHDLKSSRALNCRNDLNNYSQALHKIQNLIR